MLNNAQVEEVVHTVKASLDSAEEVWRRHGEELGRKSLAVLESFAEQDEKVVSRIPDHELVDRARPEIDDFVAFVADMRGSSSHLVSAISEKKAKVSQLQRVYYETSALLPAFELAVSYEKGSVTEYLGDGILALFKVDIHDEGGAIKGAYRAARNCVGRVLQIVNDELFSRYNLPPLVVGVGLSCSKALVHVVGIHGNGHPKVIGECVYRATKLSGGNNEIYVDEAMYARWPTSKNGRLHFRGKEVRNVKGYLVRKV